MSDRADEIARELAKTLGFITAIDSATPMIAAALRSYRNAGLEDAADYVSWMNLETTPREAAKAIRSLKSNKQGQQ